MKLIVALFSLIVAASATHLPQYQYNQYRPLERTYPAVAQTRTYGPDGNFEYSYRTEDGRSVQAQGYLKDRNTEVIQGEFSYTAPDGTPVSTRYIADENGYRPEGAHLPQTPVLRAVPYTGQYPTPVVQAPLARAAFPGYQPPKYPQHRPTYQKYPTYHQGKPQYYVKPQYHQH